MDSVTLILIAAIAGTAALLLLDRVIPNALLAAAMVFVLTMRDALQVLEGVEISGFEMTISDLIITLLALATAARFLRGARTTVPMRFFLAIAAIALFSLLRGIQQFGVQVAVNEFRVMFAFVVVALYFSTVDPTRERREGIARQYLVVGAALVLLAIVRWLSVLGPLPLTGEWYSPESYGGLRVLWSDAALVSAQALLLLAPALLRRNPPTPQVVLAAGLGLAILLTQHRSVWAVLLVGFSAVLLSEGKLGFKWALRLVTGSTIAAILLLTFFSGPLLERNISGSDAAGTDTFEWRVEGWTALYRDSGPESLTEVLLGRPYGAGWERQLTSLGYSTDVTPHNFYVELSLRIGVVGVGLLVLVYVMLLRSLWRTPSQHNDRVTVSDRMLAVILLTQLVYFIPYWPAPEQAIALGLAMAAYKPMHSQRRTRDARTSRSEFTAPRRRGSRPQPAAERSS